MPLPTVAIVGRPNVGKSTLFNRLVGKRLALVDDRPGVTRDRREGEGHLLGLEFRVMDTAGFEDQDPASLPGRMRAQTEAAVREAGRLEAFALGLGEPFALSAEHGEGLVDLFEAIRPHVEHEHLLTEAEEEEEGEGPLKLAIVGRPNAGKSTLVNKMLGEERMITGPEAGITRDSISLDWMWNDKAVRLVDTAGLRKRAKVEDKLEKLSVWDTRRAIDHAEVVVLLLDATRGLEVQDLKIASQVLEEGRALVIALNKWDVAEGASALFNGVKAALDEGLSQLKGVPLLTVSGKTGKGIDQLLGAAFEVRENWSRRVSTGELNRWFERAVETNPPPAPGGKRIKLRYITQVKSRPPSFVIFGTRVDQLPKSYERYLLNSMRRDLKLGPVPLRLTLRAPKNPFDDKGK
jgi:GTP-binding protein